jgi:hypothetical protein
MGTLVVEGADELIEASLLLQKVACNNQLKYCYM